MSGVSESVYETAARALEAALIQDDDATWTDLARAGIDAVVEQIRAEGRVTVTTVAELDTLPAGSIVLDLGDDNADADSPVVACKAARGDWQLLGDDPDRRWWPEEMINGAAGTPLTVVYTLTTERNPS